MEREEITPGCTVILGDSSKILRGFRDESFGAVVSDPPFGIGFKYVETENCKSPEKYWEEMKDAFSQMDRVLKKGGLFCIWQAHKYFKHFWEWFGDDIHVYAGCKNFVQLRKTPINYGFDPIILKYKEGAKPIRPENPDRSIDFFVADTARFVLETGSHASKHPCPRPIDQVTEIVKNFTGKGVTVLDPFMGSGTTGEACLVTGRKFVGIEVERKYYELSKDRLKEFMKSMDTERTVSQL